MTDRSTRAEYRDPSDFPCMVAGCDERANGWVMRDSLAVFGLTVTVETEADRIFMCEGHLRPIRGE